MKLVALTSAALLAATSAFAGNVNYQATPDVPVVIETPTAPVAGGNTGGSSGGSASWVLPVVGLVAVGAVLLACNDDDDN